MSDKRRLSAALDAARRKGIQAALLSWFLKNARDLPWRRTRDPWHVLVSEVMLQQIQVQRAVLPDAADFVLTASRWHSAERLERIWERDHQLRLRPGRGRG